MTTIVLQPGCYYVADSLYGLFNYEKASATTRSFWEMTTKDGIVKEMDGIICLDIEVDTRSSAGAYFSGDLVKALKQLLLPQLKVMKWYYLLMMNILCVYSKQTTMMKVLTITIAATTKISQNRNQKRVLIIRILISNTCL